jgi:hypothetical protein
MDEVRDFRFFLERAIKLIENGYVLDSEVYYLARKLMEIDEKVTARNGTAAVPQESRLP